MQQEPHTCYICCEPAFVNDAENDANPLILSPCNNCKMHVHRQCLDRFLIREASQERCVLMKTHENNQGSNHVIYCTCTMCKCRFEYSSQALIDTLTKVNHLIRSNLLRSSFQQSMQAQIGQPHSTENTTENNPHEFVSDASNNIESLLTIIQELPTDIQARVFNFMNIL